MIYDKTKPVSPTNTPSPWKGNPGFAQECGRKGAIARAAKSPERKALEAVRKQATARYSEAIEDMLSECHKIMKLVKKELTTRQTRRVELPDGKIEEVELPLSEGKIELLLKYQKQLHEQVLGRPKQVVDGKIDSNITLIIQEEQEPIDITPNIKILTSNVGIEEQDDPAIRVQPDTGESV